MLFRSYTYSYNWLNNQVMFLPYSYVTMKINKNKIKVQIEFHTNEHVQSLKNFVTAIKQLYIYL